MSNLGERLRELRKRSGKTQKEFGELFDLSESAIGMYERNQRRPDYETLKRFASHFNTTVNYLLYGKTENNPLPQSDKLSDKDERDIAKRMEKIKQDLAADGGLSFYGEPLSEEAKESLLEAMEYAVRTAQRINKKYIPKKYREEGDN